MTLESAPYGVQWPSRRRNETNGALLRQYLHVGRMDTALFIHQSPVEVQADQRQARAVALAWLSVVIVIYRDTFL